MARARNIKPSFFKNELLGQADPLLSLLFASLWTLADKSGRLEDRPMRIKAETFPYRENIDINGYLTQLVSLGFIWRYEVDGNHYIQVIEFVKHQSPHSTEKSSVIPECPVEFRTKSAAYKILALSNESAAVTSHINVLIPDSLNIDSLIPDSPNLIPLVTAAEKSTATKAKVSGTGETWSSYSNAYFDRYGIGPVRNAKTNAQIVQFVKRIGEAESPHVAAFFVSHNNAYYVKQMHSLDPMVKDCEKLRTEWATQTQMTHTKAMQTDKTQTNQDAFAPLLAEARLREANDGIQ